LVDAAAFLSAAGSSFLAAPPNFTPGEEGVTGAAAFVSPEAFLSGKEGEGEEGVLGRLPKGDEPELDEPPLPKDDDEPDELELVDEPLLPKDDEPELGELLPNGLGFGVVLAD
jgi:hypothetical protein